MKRSKTNPQSGARSPATRVLTSRALKKGSPWKSPKKSVAASFMDQSDSDNTTIPHEKLVELLGRQSWKGNLRQSAINPTFEHGKDSTGDSNSEIPLRQTKSTSVQQATKRMFLQDENSRDNKDTNDGDSIDSNRQPSKESLEAFKPSRQVRHTDSEDSEADVVKRPKARRSPRKISDHRLEEYLPNLTANKTVNPIPAEVDSDPESPIKLRRKLKKSIRPNDTNFMDLQLNRTTLSTRQNVSAESSELDSPIVAKRQKLRKSTRRTDNYFDLMSFHSTGSDHAHVSNINDSESDGELIPARRTRAKKSVRKTDIGLLNLELNSPRPEKDASVVDTTSEEEIQARPKRTQDAKKSAISLGSPPPNKENQSAQEMELDSDADKIDMSNRRSLRSRDKTNPDIQLPPFTPEKKVPEENVTSDAAESPLNLRRQSRSFRENLGTSQPIFLTPSKLNSPMKRTDNVSDPESPLKMSRKSKRLTSNNLTPIQMPVLEESIREAEPADQSPDDMSVDDSIGRKSKRLPVHSTGADMQLPSLASPEQAGKNLTVVDIESSDEEGIIQARKSRSSVRAAAEMSPVPVLSEGSEEEEEIPRRRVEIRKSVGSSPGKSPARRSSRGSASSRENAGQFAGAEASKTMSSAGKSLEQSSVLSEGSEEEEIPRRRVERRKSVGSSPAKSPAKRSSRGSASSGENAGQFAGAEASKTMSSAGKSLEQSSVLSEGSEEEEEIPKRKVERRKSVGSSPAKIPARRSSRGSASSGENARAEASKTMSSADKSLEQSSVLSEESDVEVYKRKKSSKRKSNREMNLVLSPPKSPARRSGAAMVDLEKADRSTVDEVMSPVRRSRRTSRAVSEESEEDLQSRNRMAARKSSRNMDFDLSPAKSPANRSETTNASSRDNLEETDESIANVVSNRKQQAAKSLSKKSSVDLPPVQENDKFDESQHAEESDDDLPLPRQRFVKKSTRSIPMSLSPARSSVRSTAPPQIQAVEEEGRKKSIVLGSDKRSPQKSTRTSVKEAEDMAVTPDKTRMSSMRSRDKSSELSKEEENLASKSKNAKEKSFKVMKFSSSPFKEKVNEPAEQNATTKNDTANLRDSSTSRLEVVPPKEKTNNASFEMDLTLWEEASDLNKSVSSHISSRSKNHEQLLENMFRSSVEVSIADDMEQAEISSTKQPQIMSEQLSMIANYGSAEGPIQTVNEVAAIIPQEESVVSDESTIHIKRTNLQKTPKQSIDFGGFKLFSTEKQQERAADDSSEGEEIISKRRQKKSDDKTVELPRQASRSGRSALPANLLDISANKDTPSNSDVAQFENSKTLAPRKPAHVDESPKSAEKQDETSRPRQSSLLAASRQSGTTKSSEAGKEVSKQAEAKPTKKSSNMNLSETMELDYSMEKDETHQEQTVSKKSIKDPESMFLESSIESLEETEESVSKQQSAVSEEPEKAAPKQSTEAAEQDSILKTDSEIESGSDDTPVVFKRRKISYQKSKEQPNISLKLSFNNSEKQNEVEQEEPQLGKTVTFQNESLPEEDNQVGPNGVGDLLDSEGISMMDEEMQRFTMFQYTGESNANDIFRSAARRKTAPLLDFQSLPDRSIADDPLSSAKVGPDVANSSVSEAEKTKQAPGKKQSAKALRISEKSPEENVKRNLLKNMIDVAQEELSQSKIQVANEEPRTSTPVDDVALTLQDMADAVKIMENNLEANKDTSDARHYTADDFKTVVSLFKQPRPSSKSKKLFSLTDFEKAMVAVRSPSMMMDASKRDSIAGMKSMFSIQDFERAVMKLKLKSGGRFSTSVINDISSIFNKGETPIIRNLREANKIVTPAVADVPNTAEKEGTEVEPRDAGVSTVLPNDQKSAEYEENMTIADTPSDRGDDNSGDDDDSNSHSSSEKTIEESQSVHSEVDDTNDHNDSDKTVEDIQSSEVESTQNFSPTPDEEVGKSQDTQKTVEQESSEGDISLGIIEEYNREVEIAEDNQARASPPRLPPSNIREKSPEDAQSLRLNQAVNKRQALITSFLGNASNSASNVVRRSLLTSGEMSPPPLRFRQGDLNESGVAPTQSKEGPRSYFTNYKQHLQEKLKKAEPSIAAQIASASASRKPLAIKKNVAPLIKNTNRNFKKPDAKTYKSVNILVELKKAKWVNKRLLLRLKKHFKNETPRVMNDFIRNLYSNIEAVMKPKKVNPDKVMEIMKACHKAGVASNYNEFCIFMREYLPTSFEEKAFSNNLFRDNYYDFGELE